MQRHLNLIQDSQSYEEKRVFPRFPFCSMTFKTDGSDLTFHVNDISFSGMQVMLRDGHHNFKEGDTYKGKLHWIKQTAEVEVTVVWTDLNSAGLSFNDDEALSEFLSYEHLHAGMKALHQAEIDLDIPHSLKYWLQSASAFELLVWAHSDGELGKFQIIFMDHFVEWNDGEGLRTGLVIDKRDHDTPLVHEDEFTLQMDNAVDSNRLSFCSRFVNTISERYLPEQCREFIVYKLRP